MKRKVLSSSSASATADNELTQRSAKRPKQVPLGLGLFMNNSFNSMHGMCILTNWVWRFWLRRRLPELLSVVCRCRHLTCLSAFNAYMEV